MSTPHERIVSQLAEQATRRVCRRVIRQLQAFTSADIEHPFEHLHTFWDQLCTQVQWHQTPRWNIYLGYLDVFIEAEVDTLPVLASEAIWLQTKAGRDWVFDDEKQSDVPPFDTSDLERLIRTEVLYLADGWTNAALRAQHEADSRGYSNRMY